MQAPISQITRPTGSETPLKIDLRAGGKIVCKLHQTQAVNVNTRQSCAFKTYGLLFLTLMARSCGLLEVSADELLQIES